MAGVMSLSPSDTPSRRAYEPNRLLKNPFSPRLLKKVQMQGGVPDTHPQDGCRCETYLVRTSQRRASAGVPTEGGSPQMGLFQQPARAKRITGGENGRDEGLDCQRQTGSVATPVPGRCCRYRSQPGRVRRCRHARGRADHRHLDPGPGRRRLQGAERGLPGPHLSTSAGNINSLLSNSTDLTGLYNMLGANDLVCRDYYEYTLS